MDFINQIVDNPPVVDDFAGKPWVFHIYISWITQDTYLIDISDISDIRIQRRLYNQECADQNIQPSVGFIC